MLKFLKNYCKIILAIISLIIVFGFILPYLFSMESDMAILLGCIILVTSLYPFIYTIYTLITKGVGMIKKYFSLFLIFTLCIFMVACSRVEPGYVGIKVYLLGTSKGVSQEVLGVGRYWIGINENLYLFPTFIQNVRWTESITDFSPRDEAIRFQDKNIMTLTADVGFSYTLQKEKIPNLFQRHRKGIEEITNIYLRNIIQNSFNVVGGTMEFSEINGNSKSIFLQKVLDEVNRSLKDEGFTIEKLTLLDLRPPEDVKKSISNKMQAQQLAQQAKAEAEATLTKAKAEAESIRLKTLTVTPLLIQYEAIQKWNGELPKVTSNVIPFINLNSKYTENVSIEKK